MGSKKHKKESKKKKYRSRSRSPIDVEERERRRHKRHKDRKKDLSPDVEEVPVDSHLVNSENNGGSNSNSRSLSRSPSVERDRRVRELHRAHKDTTTREINHEKEYSKSPIIASSSTQESLSIEETNRLRAKLGLKPLECAEKPNEDGKIKDDLGEFYHKPATNIAQQKKTDKIREKLEERKEKRKLEQKLKTTLLAEDSDDDDTSAWVLKSRELEKQKQEASKRAAMLDELDQVWGVGALVEEEQREEREKAYASTHLKGLRVAHDLDAVAEEQETVLTLADQHVLAEDHEDVLVNVNMLDNERYKKNIEERKKARAGYQAYDDEADLEAAALGYQKPVLSKYDDEIEPGKTEKQKGFIIGDEDALQAKKFRDMLRQERLQGGVNKRLESLRMPQPRIAPEYMDEHEIQAKFKKIKKRGKIRKKPKQEPIDVDDYEAGFIVLETDDTEVKPELLKTELAVDDEEVEVNSELQAALARARKLRQSEVIVPKVEEILDLVKKEEIPEELSTDASAIVLDATAEFCRTLGDIPTYGLAGNRDHQAEIMDFEEEAESNIENDIETSAGAWSRVDVDNEKPPDLTPGAAEAVCAEPALGAGVAGALRLARSKGYLARAPPPPAAPRALLPPAAYCIDDKAHGGEDDKYGRRERGYAGPTQEFRELPHFRPHIKLDYVDDDGRPLCPKEAFRYLSHKFHGKGPGKNKQEKRIKKAVQEGLMKKMSSTDTPLGTLQMLQDKQKETQSPYIVLSGAKRDNNH